LGEGDEALIISGDTVAHQASPMAMCLQSSSGSILTTFIASNVIGFYKKADTECLTADKCSTFSYRKHKAGQMVRNTSGKPPEVLACQDPYQSAATPEVMIKCPDLYLPWSSVH